VILTDPSEILKAEQEIAARYQSIGHPASWAQCGVFYEDPWLYMVRDIVRFPAGNLGTYHHLILKGGNDGVVILPVVNRKIVLLRHFRNGARDWSWEIPRGAPRSVDPIDNARDELTEEIGAEILHIEKIGAMRNNNGLITELMHIYFATLKSFSSPNLSEGIGTIRMVTPDELTDGIVKGTIDDSHTVHAFTLARLKNLM
jgi:ADP-ribose pyrophosphatase